MIDGCMDLWTSGHVTACNEVRRKLLGNSKMLCSSYVAAGPVQSLPHALTTAKFSETMRQIFMDSVARLVNLPPLAGPPMRNCPWRTSTLPSAHASTCCLPSNVSQRAKNAHLSVTLRHSPLGSKLTRASLATPMLYLLPSSIKVSKDSKGSSRRSTTHN